MWWQYQRIFIDQRYVRYRYSRESKKLDGIIQFDRITKSIDILQPCSVDRESLFCQKKAKEHFYQLIREGFPEERQVACG